MRDDFTESTKLLLAKRVGTICSNPECCAPTFGPNHDPHKTTSKGVAAHLTSASSGGPRYDPKLTSDERRHYNNGIWLCQSCARIIDVDENGYSLSLLKSWKQKAENRAQRALKNPSLVNTGPNFAETIVLVLVQRDPIPMNPPPRLPIPPGHVAFHEVSLEPIDMPHNVRDVNLLLKIAPAGSIPPGNCLISIICQNQGTGLDQNIKIDINFKSGAIIRHDLLEQDRVRCINGGSNGSWSASFAIADLLPGEYRCAIVGARDEPFTVDVWSQNSARKVNVFTINIVSKGWKTQPIEDSPYES